MRILWVGTKVPWPPQDGGRLVAWLTIQALHQAGHRVTLIAPSAAPIDAARLERLREACAPVIVDASPTGGARAWLATLASPRPWTAIRHAWPALRRAVDEILARESFDVVHAEQPHALAACAGALGHGRPPLVLRAHNVEADLWAAAGREGGLRGLLARREALRVGRWEAEAVRRAAATIALTAEDAGRLRALAGADARVHHLAAPFPARLPPAASALPGDPALVLSGSGGWLPNERGLAWFGQEIWPPLARAFPGVRLHVFGDAGEAPAGSERHPAPADSRDAFAPGSIQVVPLRFASGVRMRILEAWARGVPVIATPEAAAGLGATDGQELAIASTAAEFAEAIRRVTRASTTLVTGGRARLASHHDPARQAAALAGLYEDARGPESLIAPV